MGSCWPGACRSAAAVRPSRFPTADAASAACVKPRMQPGRRRRRSSNTSVTRGERAATCSTRSACPSACVSTSTARRRHAVLSRSPSDGKQSPLTTSDRKSLLRGPALPCNVERFTRVPFRRLRWFSCQRRGAVLVHDAAAARSAGRAGFWVWARVAYKIRIASKHGAARNPSEYQSMTISSFPTIGSGCRARERVSSTVRSSTPRSCAISAGRTAPPGRRRGLGPTLPPRDPPAPPSYVAGADFSPGLRSRSADRQRGSRSQSAAHGGDFKQGPPPEYECATLLRRLTYTGLRSIECR